MNRRSQIFESAFPFHILLNQELEIVNFGRSLVKLGFDLENSPKLTDLFQIQRPSVDADFPSILEHSSSVFILAARNNKITLKGQMLEVGYHGKSEVVFLCSPVLRNLDEADEAGLKMSDFALHDSALDYLVLMQVQGSVHRDTKRLADKLLEETKARRKAQKVLEETNISLETKVLERTEELSKANSKLGAFVERLHASNMDLRMLNEVDEVLHRCRTVHEAFPTVIKAMRQLFPNSCGRISCYEDDLGLFKVSAEWGDEKHRLEKTFSGDECPAIAGGTAFSGYGPDSESGCPELEGMGDEYYFCRPLRFGDATLGLVHFHYGRDVANEDQETWQQSRQTLADTLVKHMGMGLSNIRLRQKLEEESIRDPMTRLFNRRYMESVLEQELAKAKRDAHSAFGLILLDVDHFKKFNDTHGHQAGDQVLIQLASLLSSQVRKGDVACRYGGEEFLLILSNSTVEDAARRAEAIRVATEQLCIDYSDTCLVVTISAGVTGYNNEDDSVDSVVRRADNALYEAKEQGRNRVVVG